MKLVATLSLLLMLALTGCDGSAAYKAKNSARPGKGVVYFLSVDSMPGAPLTRDRISAVTLLPMPATDSTDTNGGKPAVAAGFSELPIDVLDLQPLDGGIYRLQLKEAPQVDGVVRIRIDNAEYQMLMLETGSHKHPVRVDAASTAAVRMFLKRVLAQQSYNNVDVEQVNTLVSVVAKHLETLDVPDKLDAAQQIDWYAERAEKACTLRLSSLSTSAECAAFTLGGEIRGLNGQLQLVVNRGEPLLVTASGPFMFRTGLINRSYYDVTVKEQPQRQTCVVKYGNGRIHGENVDSILVKCDDNRYQMAGVAEGIVGAIKLKLNGAVETISIKKDGPFHFTSKLKHGDAYEITLAHQPQDMSCSLSHGAGYVIDNVADISVSCEPLLFQVGGVVNGLQGSVRLKINDGEELRLSEDGEFSFATDFVHKALYNVQIVEQPVGQNCQIARAQGKLALIDIKNVEITCSNNQYAIAGRAEGLKSPVTINLNGEEPVTLESDGEFHFNTRLPFGSEYQVNLDTALAGQQCAFLQGEGRSAGKGVVGGDNVQLLLHCEPQHYRLGGVVRGLAGAFQLRLNNREEVLAIPSNGPFSFAKRLATGERYTVVMDNPPAGQSCKIGNGVGQMGSQDVRSLTVDCDFQGFKLGGSVSGLKGNLKLALNGDTEQIVLSSNGMFAFSSEVRTGDSYNVTVAGQPEAQVCEVRKGTGQVNAANIVDIRVICAPAALSGKALSSQPAPAEGGGANPGDGSLSSEKAMPGENASPVETGPKTFAAPFPQINKP